MRYSLSGGSDDRGESVTGSQERTVHGSTLRDYLQVVRRRKWIILQAALLAPAVAVGLSLQQERLYEAQSEVLLSRQNLAASLTGTPDPSAYVQADRLAQTQADLARVPEVARRVLAELRLTDRTSHDLLDASEVSAKPNADLLVFSVTDPSGRLAQRLVSEYAHQFTLYRGELDTASLQRARLEVSSRLKALEQRGQQRGALYASLAEKEQQLGTMEALQTANAFVIREADRALQVQPRPVRNGVLGLALGLVLGIGLAFLWEALDTRVRTAQEISERLGLPLLARLAAPPKRLRKEDRLVMLAEPTGIQAEAFRMLRTNLEFTRLDRGARTIMITSALEREGKSTTAANLAVALARGGQRVHLVDLDLRRPCIDRFFDLDGRPGLTQIALGHTTLGEALTPIPLEATERQRIAASPNGKGNPEGALLVLRSGPLPPDAGEFVATHALSEILEALRDTADTVIIDAPPLLHVGDAMALSTKVDAVLVVTRINVLRRGALSELHRLLDSIPAHKLGFIVTGAGEEDGYGSYGEYYYEGTHAPHQEPVA